MLRAIDRLVAAVDMTAKPKEITLPNGDEFSFFAAPLTAAERERALKNAGSGSDSAAKFSMDLIINKVLDESGRKVFAPGEAARLRHDLPSKVLDDLLSQILENGDEESEDEAEATPKRTSRKAEA